MGVWGSKSIVQTKETANLFNTKIASDVPEEVYCESDDLGVMLLVVSHGYR